MTSTLRPEAATSALGTATAPGAGPADPSRRPVGVPWLHVLPFAVVLSFANGFWLNVLRGAVGSIARTSDPFASWLRESTLLVPAYAAAVVVAFALGYRFAGKRPRGFRGTAAALVLIAAAAVVTGVLIQAASSMLDLRLQIHDIEHMGVHSACATDCVSQRIHATWQIELKALAVGAILLAVTDLVMVALVYAARGGNLLLASTPKTSRSGSGSSAGADQRLLLAIGLVGAAAIHAAVVPEHLREWTAAGVFFIVVTLAALGVAAAVLLHRPAARERSLLAAIALSLLQLGVWAVSRTVGLPFGPEAGEAEPVGLADYMACVLELTALVIAVGLLLRLRRIRASEPPHERRPWGRHALGVAIASLVTATTLGVAGSTLPLVASFTGVVHEHGAEQGASGAG